MGNAASLSTVVPGDFPELALLAWNRDPARPIPAAEAFALYEANWRHVDPGRMTPAETALLDGLARDFGHGDILAAGRHGFRHRP